MRPPSGYRSGFVRASKKPAEVTTLKELRALFAEMRENHVFVFRGLGLSIQMSQSAWDQPRVKPVPQQPQDQEVALADMPPELSGPYLAAQALARIRRDPTHPDAEVDDAAEQGDDLPSED